VRRGRRGEIFRERYLERESFRERYIFRLRERALERLREGETY
jgi:hypothetical protein